MGFNSAFKALIGDRNLNDDLIKYFYAAALCLIGKHKTQQM